MHINFVVEYFILILLIGCLLIYVFKNEPEIVIKEKKDQCTSEHCVTKIESENKNIK